MLGSIPNKFEVDGDVITIYRDGWECLAFTTYREDYFNEICSHTWSMNANRYPMNSSLGGGLHRYIMKKWYGDDVVDEFTKKGYVIDHINNEHNDCTISNLEFLKKDYNTAKGQQLDKDTKRLNHRLALTVFKDFDTNCYQITVGCNDAICGKDHQGNVYYVQSFKFLYKGDYNRYPIVLNDAESILLSYEMGDGISLDKTKAAMVRIYHLPNIELSEEEKKQVFVTRGNQVFVVIGNNKAYYNRVAPDKGWKLPEEYDGRQMIQHCIPKGFE